MGTSDERSMVNDSLPFLFLPRSFPSFDKFNNDVSPLSNVSLHLSVAFLARIKKKKKEKKSPRTNRNDRFLPRSVTYSRPSLSFYHTIERKLYNHACASCSAPRYTIPRYQMRHSLTNENNLSNGKWSGKLFSIRPKSSMRQDYWQVITSGIISITSFSRVQLYPFD